MGCIHACLSLTVSFHIGFKHYELGHLDKGLSQLEWTVQAFKELENGTQKGVDPDHLNTTLLQSECWGNAIKNVKNVTLVTGQRERLAEV